MADQRYFTHPEVQAVHLKNYRDLITLLKEFDNALRITTISPATASAIATASSIDEGNDNIYDYFLKFARAVGNDQTSVVPNFSINWETQSTGISSLESRYYKSIMFALSKTPYTNSPSQRPDNINYFDFHVIRMAQLTMYRITFKLVSAVMEYYLLKVYTSGGEPSNLDLDNILILAKKLDSCYNHLQQEDKDMLTKSETENYSMAKFYVDIKKLSNSNLDKHANLKSLHLRIKEGRQNLNTSMAGEYQVQKILKWSKYQFWFWLIMLIASVFILISFLYSENHFLLYIFFTSILVIFATLILLRWFKIRITMWDIKDLGHNIGITLPIRL